ncbi:MAG: hypothetical protein GY861_01645 [bacterium]|nr:hypothetical protein [bacterium]
MSKSKLETFVEKLRIAFKSRIGTKTGWGKNQVINEFEFSIADALLKMGGEDESIQDTEKEG